jgi:hypothetical protein
MKQKHRAFNFTLGIACSLVLGVMAGQSASGSIAGIGGSTGSSISIGTSTVSTSTVSVPGQITSTSTPGWSIWGGPGNGGHLSPCPEANAGFILAALLPLMLLITPTRVRKALAVIRSRGSAV